MRKRKSVLTFNRSCFFFLNGMVKKTTKWLHCACWKPFFRLLFVLGRFFSEAWQRSRDCPAAPTEAGDWARPPNAFHVLIALQPWRWRMRRGRIKCSSRFCLTELRKAAKAKQIFTLPDLGGPKLRNPRDEWVHLRWMPCLLPVTTSLSLYEKGW